ncbi:DUF421 domain-containing protein [Paenibacillus turpanensis]|uniref:DUF421 domain-containing protein n=1 Tax=Paenibacillus turpanensis TaxID=2689078 RepID=UPI0014096841|nr:DUF421 domain-containing protein [Paenibacillus turpanensis]
MSSYLNIALELFIGFLALFTYTKIMGKTHFSQLTPFDFISVLILGELLGNAVYDDEVDIWKVLFATGLWAVLIFSSLFVTQKNNKLRKLLEGEPSIIIHKGKIEYKTMKKNNMDMNQLQSLVRQQGHLSVSELEHAILETNGSLSVFPKPDYAPPTNKNLRVKAAADPIPVTLILDGKLVDGNFKEAGVDRSWLMEQLARRKISHHKEVLLAELKGHHELFIQTK